MTTNLRDQQEAELHYPLGDTLPALGASLEVAPGVRWLRMPLPFALDHINLWLLRDVHDSREGWTVVDCGIANDTIRAAWEQVFAAELEGLPVLRVLVTHMHPDHIGLAHWISERWRTPQADCRVWISATDWLAARNASRGTMGMGGDGAAAFFARHGLVDEASLAQVRARRDYYPGLVPAVPERYRRLMDGMVLTIGGRAWRCISGYGHAPEHMSLHCAEIKVLIAGDMLLPRISTNVSVIETEPEANPLPLYLDSIRRFESLPAETLVLPSHGKPFRGAHTRIAQLVAHHDERLADVLRVCSEAPASAHDLLPVLFRRPLDLHQTTFAMGEAVAHVHMLLEAGRLARVSGDDGIWRFVTQPGAKDTRT